MADPGERWSWGRAHLAQHQVERPLWREEALDAVRRRGLRVLGRGLGRSYGDSGLNDGGRIIDMTGLDRLIAFDSATGIVACDAGFSLDALLRWLRGRGTDSEDADGQGYWLPAVMPGTRFVTVGGAIANDVHGKNHHRFGTFGEHVLELELARSDGALITCSRQREPGLFAATIGGLGLTGLILSARLQLRRVSSLWLDSEDIAIANLDAFFALAEESADTWEYTVAWFDSLASGSARGRGIFTRARHASADQRLPPPLVAPRLAVPFVPPFSPVTPLTARLFNGFYTRRLLGRARVQRAVPLYRALFALDGVADWNRLYGAPGFYQYQCVVPKAATKSAISSLLDRIARSGQGSFLTVIKTFAAHAPAGVLSFPIEGTTLALDFPNRGEKTLALLETLDEIVAGAGGRVYPAKDGRLSRTSFERFYPQHERFRAFVDPGFASGFARRVGLVEP